MGPQGIDSIRINLNTEATAGLAWILAFMMFSVGLGLCIADFRRAFSRPRVLLFGVALQVLVLPCATFLLSFPLAAIPSVALGMIVVAACPSGNASNVLTLAARGDAAISVSLTAIVSLLAVLSTPLNIMFWAGLRPDTAVLLQTIGVDRGAFLRETIVTLGIPLALGLLIAERAARWAVILRRPLYTLSLVVLVGFIIGALIQNGRPLAQAARTIVPVLLVQDAMALALGYFGARAARLDEAVCRAFAFETGIRNVGLGLVIVLSQLRSIGGAALIAAGWGVWHLMSGGLLAAWWARRPPRPNA